MSHVPSQSESMLKAHLQELQSLWDMRRRTSLSPDYLARDVAELDERIEANIDGLVLGGEDALPILYEAMAGDDLAGLFVAAHVLLTMNQPAAADRVTDVFAKAEGNKLPTLRDALCRGPIDLVAERLGQIHRTGPPALAAAAALVLSSHRRINREPDRLGEFFGHEDPEVRRTAWIIMAFSSG